MSEPRPFVRSYPRHPDRPLHRGLLEMACWFVATFSWVAVILIGSNLAIPVVYSLAITIYSWDVRSQVRPPSVSKSLGVIFGGALFLVMFVLATFGHLTPVFDVGATPLPVVIP